MKRPWHMAVVFGLCLAVVLAAMAWTSAQVLRLDRMEAEAAAQEPQEGNIRLALWRMESALMPLVAQEASQPYFAYTAFYPAERAYTRMLGNVAAGEILLPSPLLAQSSPYILVNFQVAPGGEVTSPQVPVGNMRNLAVPTYTTPQAIEKASAALAELKPHVSDAALAAMLPMPEEGPAPMAVVSKSAEGPALAANTLPLPPQGANTMNINNGLPLTQQGDNGQNASNSLTQEQRNINEYQARNRQQFLNSSQIMIQNIGNQRLLPAEFGDVREGMIKAVWVGDVLVLARRVSVNGREYIQGAWLDWAAVRTWLLEEVADLLPEAQLVPANGSDSPESTQRLLAALPVRLVPGAMPLPEAAGLSPLVFSLGVAWAGTLLAAVAVGLLLWKAVSLSERRAAFVSAVTHELRTPLTTFRMYSEMLAGDMVPDEAKRLRYLNTLRIEADRLTHLVENVLSYARLERKPMRRRLEPVPLADLVGRARGRLADRAAQAGMELVTEVPEAAGAFKVLADPSAAEQILFNLVDNACKYAARAADRRIHLVVEAGSGGARLTVCDHGPGISATEARRLFRPFTKSARDAANSAPGVGLGLALSRRLAREMGGDLKIEPAAGAGACFVLHLPAA